MAKRFAVAGFAPVTDIWIVRLRLVVLSWEWNAQGIDQNSLRLATVAKETDVFESFRFLPHPFELASSALLNSERFSDISSDPTIQHCRLK